MTGAKLMNDKLPAPSQIWESSAKTGKKRNVTTNEPVPGGVYRNPNGYTFQFICRAYYKDQNVDVAVFIADYGGSHPHNSAQEYRVFAQGFARGGYELVSAKSKPKRDLKKE